MMKYNLLVGILSLVFTTSVYTTAQVHLRHLQQFSQDSSRDEWMARLDEMPIFLTEEDEDSLALEWLEKWGVRPGELNRNVLKDEGIEWSPLRLAIRAAASGVGFGPVPPFFEGAGFVTEEGSMADMQHLSLSVVRSFIRMGADVDWNENLMKKTPLIEAAERGSARVCSMLLEAGANVDGEDLFGRTALNVAAHFGHTQVCTLLMSYSPSVTTEQWHSGDGQVRGGNALHAAAKNGHAEIMNLLTTKRDEQAINGLSADKMTPLQLASEHGHTQSVRALLMGGANADMAFHEDGRSAMHLAALHGHHEACEALLHIGSAKIDTPDSSGATPLILAAHGGHLRTVKFLIDSRANVNKQDDKGHTPLISAAYGGHTEAIKALVQAGADLNQVDSNSRTALLIAAESGHEAAALTLVHLGADVEAAPEGRMTPLHHAIKNHLKVLCIALVQHGADINSKGPGLTPLDVAVEEGDMEAAKTLTSLGADPSAGKFHLQW